MESGREQFQWLEAPAQGPVVHTLSGLRAASAYELRVAAAGGAPAELRARTLSDAPAAPPANVTALATGANVSPTSLPCGTPTPYLNALGTQRL